MKFNLPDIEVNLDRVGSRVYLTYDCSDDAKAVESEKAIKTFLKMAQLAIEMDDDEEI